MMSNVRAIRLVVGRCLGHGRSCSLMMMMHLDDVKCACNQIGCWTIFGAHAIEAAALDTVTALQLRSRVFRHLIHVIECYINTSAQHNVRALYASLMKSTIGMAASY
eukprot:SAG31_NODE_24416_length_481_cov_4.890052_1_plen_107_part_00